MTCCDILSRTNTFSCRRGSFKVCSLCSMSSCFAMFMHNCFHFAALFQLFSSRVNVIMLLVLMLVYMCTLVNMTVFKLCFSVASHQDLWALVLVIHPHVGPVSYLSLFFGFCWMKPLFAWHFSVSCVRFTLQTALGNAENSSKSCISSFIYWPFHMLNTPKHAQVHSPAMPCTFIHFYAHHSKKSGHFEPTAPPKHLITMIIWSHVSIKKSSHQCPCKSQIMHKNHCMQQIWPPQVLSYRGQHITSPQPMWSLTLRPPGAYILKMVHSLCPLLTQL